MEWQPIETAPRNKKVLVAYRNICDKWRTVTAANYEEGMLPVEESDYDDETEFAPEGWYETSETSEVVYMLDYEPTHWMPLPPHPTLKLEEKTL